MYLIEIYDEAIFNNTYPYLFLAIKRELSLQGVANFEFVQCLSLNGTNVAITYVDPNNEDLTATVECLSTDTSVSLEVEKD